jgi:hypothetical protein
MSRKQTKGWKRFWGRSFRFSGLTIERIHQTHLYLLGRKDEGIICERFSLRFEENRNKVLVCTGLIYPWSRLTNYLYKNQCLIYTNHYKSRTPLHLYIRLFKRFQRDGRGRSESKGVYNLIYRSFQTWQLGGVIPVLPSGNPPRYYLALFHTG